MSDRNSVYAALISNIRNRDRAKDAEHLHDVLRFINDVNEIESRFGKIRNDEKTESLLNNRFRGASVS